MQSLPLIVASLITEHPDQVGTGSVSDHNRSIMFGRYEMMEHVVPTLRPQRDDDPDEHSIKASHPEVPDINFKAGANPSTLVAFDQKSGIYGTGTHNCLTCRHFVANNLCPKFVQLGRQVILQQDTVKSLSVGGCAQHEMVPGLGEQDNMTSEAYDQIVETVLDNDYCVVWRAGRVVGQLSHYDLGIEDPQRRQRDYDAYSGIDEFGSNDELGESDY